MKQSNIGPSTELQNSAELRTSEVQAVGTKDSGLSNSGPLIVGVGVAKGCLPDVQELVASLGNAPDLAIVLVQNFNPDSHSSLLESLTKSSPLNVVGISGRKKLKGGTVYVCPPLTLIEVKNSSLRITKPESSDPPATPIDYFLQSLAADQGERGIGVILTDGESDGVLGLKAVSDAGGLTFAHNAVPDTSDRGSQNTTLTGVADHVLPPQSIAAELKQYSTYLANCDSASKDKGSPDQQILKTIPAISKRLLEVTNHNFQHYKQNTLVRRIRRRMHVLQLKDVESYVNFLNDDKEEPQALFRELLISVTAFFRDLTAFEQLAKEVIPHLFANRQASETVRIWVPGCASGEEAYSIAILCCEYLEQVNPKPEVQIFATDIDERALKTCRKAIYPVGIEEDVSSERLRRYFVKRGDNYQLAKRVRELVLVSSHNLISDPPFSRLDLISCRNLLIYLGQHLQNKLIPMFHYALRPSGYLFLGPSENIISHGDLFQVVDTKHRISQRKDTILGSTPPLSLLEQVPSVGSVNRAPELERNSAEDLIQVMHRIVLDEFAPKSVIVEEDGKILCASADMHKYLTVGTGNFENNIIKMAREGLRHGLRWALQEAKSKRRRVDHEGLSVRTDSKLQPVMLTVQPMPRVGQENELFMVVFHDVGLPISLGRQEDVEADTLVAEGEVSNAIVSHLEKELATSRVDLEKSIQELELANEQLRTTNEELSALNEEMQAANEELEASKEETEVGNLALQQTNSDLENLLRCTQIATLFLDDELRIRRYTPAATAIYGLIPTDIGRPLTQLMPLADNIPPLPDPTTVDETNVVEHTISTRAGRWYARRVLPYYTPEGERNGIVVTFTDITELHRGRQRFASLVEASAQIVWETDAEGHVCEDSPSWRAFTGQTLEQWLGDGWVTALQPDSRESTLKTWQNAVATGVPISIRYPLRHHTGEYRWTQVNAVPLRNEDGSIRAWVGMNTDIHEQTMAKLELEQRELQIRSLISSTAEGIYGIDLEGNCTFANEACAKLLGYSTTEELLGKQMHLLIHHTHRDGTTYPVHECKVYKAYRERAQVHVDDELFWRKDGSSFDVEYWSYPQIQDDQVVGCVVTFLDVTERKKLLQNLADRESHLRRVIDNTLGFIGVLDSQGILQEANATALEAGGVTREEVIGKPFWECYWWSHDEQVIHDLKAAVATALTGEVVRYDVEIRMAGDSRLTIDFMLVPVKDSQGKITHLIPSGVDISERKWVEAEVKQRIAQLDLALESGQMGIWEWDIAVDHVTWSTRLYEMFGYTEESFKPSLAGFLTIIHPDDHPQLERMIKSVFTQTCENHEVEFRVIRGDNRETVWTHCRGKIHRNPDGSPASILSVAADVTVRKKRELSLAFLADVQSRLAALNTSNAIIAEASQRVAEYMQLSHLLAIRIELDNQSVNVFYDYCTDGSRSLVGVYDISDFATDEERRLLAAGLPLVVNDTTAKNRPQKMIDNLAALEVGSALSAPSSRDERLTFMITATKRHAHVWREDEIELLRQLSNIVRLKLERTEAEAALRDSEARFRDLADNISQLTWMADASGSVFWYNQRWFDYTGTTLEEMKGWGWKAVQHPDHLDRVVASWQHSLETGEVWEDTFPLRAKDNTYRWFLTRARPIHDADGKIQRWFGTNTDITDAKKTAEELEQARTLAEAANRSKSEFLANMSHEIRTPMTAILGYTQLISEKVKDLETIDYLRTIRRNGDFLLEIINDILDLSKVEAGKFELSQQMFSPQRLVEDVRSIMEVRASSNQIELIVEYLGAIPELIESDPKRLRQILINLVGNAVKFTQVGSVKIAVSFSEETRKMRFDVIDSGIGISESQQGRLFQPFSQGDGNVNREFGGTGLGLAISKRLTEMLGGEISFSSELGRGSTFSVIIAVGDVGRIVRVNSPGRSGDEDSDNDDLGIRLDSHILVVDDRRDIRFLSKRFLTDAGATVYEAEDGEVAVSTVINRLNEGKTFDLILLDMQMPKMDGYATAKALRKLGFDKPIVALTADAMQGDMKRCIASGCNDYLSKPIDKAVLLELVKRLTG